MQGFEMINGDIVIKNGEIQMISGANLLKQTVEMILNTNQGEWWLDPDEGINFNNILGKHNVVKNQKITKASDSIDNSLNLLLEKRLDGVI
jgi:phage baseplate assembly protein W